MLVGDGIGEDRGTGVSAAIAVGPGAKVGNAVAGLAAADGAASVGVGSVGVDVLEVDVLEMVAAAAHAVISTRQTITEANRPRSGK